MVVGNSGWLFRPISRLPRLHATEWAAYAAKVFWCYADLRGNIRCFEVTDKAPAWYDVWAEPRWQHSFSKYGAAEGATMYAGGFAVLFSQAIVAVSVHDGVLMWEYQVKEPIVASAALDACLFFCTRTRLYRINVLFSGKPVEVLEMPGDLVEFTVLDHELWITCQSNAGASS
jgi:hypothetical protein